MTRSELMARIRSKDTKPEVRVRTYLHAVGLRYRLHDKKLLGKPDIVLRKYRTAVLVHGCFWHQHQGCKYGHLPKSNMSYWQGKLERNVARDKAARLALSELGWNVEVVWECEISEAALDSLAKRIKARCPEPKRVRARAASARKAAG